MTSSLKLPDTLEMGAVTLWVHDLDSMIKFYRDAVGLDLQHHSGGLAVLGANHHPIVVLEQRSAMKYAGAHESGLFHVAILHSNRASLAHIVRNVITKYPNSFTGSADHLVSQAFYFNDPEGNGVELYWDRDRSEWSWIHGDIEMDTLFLHPNQFLAENLSDQLSDSEQRVGHVHLSVGSLDVADEFYVRVLGFDRTLNWNNQALFVSVGGYHHHMAMNTWRSKGAGVRQPTLGLANIEITVASNDELDETFSRLKFHEAKPTWIDHAIEIIDPWGNKLSLKSKS